MPRADGACPGRVARMRVRTVSRDPRRARGRSGRSPGSRVVSGSAAAGSGGAVTSAVHIVVILVVPALPVALVSIGGDRGGRGGDDPLRCGVCARRRARSRRLGGHGRGTRRAVTGCLGRGISGRDGGRGNRCRIEHHRIAELVHLGAAESRRDRHDAEPQQQARGPDGQRKQQRPNRTRRPWHAPSYRALRETSMRDQLSGVAHVAHAADVVGIGTSNSVAATRSRSAVWTSENARTVDAGRISRLPATPGCVRRPRPGLRRRGRTTAAGTRSARTPPRAPPRPRPARG